MARGGARWRAVARGGTRWHAVALGGTWWHLVARGVALTDAGRQVLLVVDKVVTERLTQTLSVLEPEERETFARLLTKIIDAFPSEKD